VFIGQIQNFELIRVVYEKESKNKIRAFYKKFLKIVETFINKTEEENKS